jgi:hypothetical protein
LTVAIADYQAHWKTAKGKFETAMKDWRDEVKARIGSLQQEQKDSLKDDPENAAACARSIKELLAAVAKTTKRGTTGLEPASKSIQAALKGVEALVAQGKTDPKDKSWQAAFLQLQSARKSFETAYTKNKTQMGLLANQPAGACTSSLRECAGILRAAADEILADGDARLQKAKAKAKA